MVEEDTQVGGFEQAYQDEARGGRLKEEELEKEAEETLKDVQSGDSQRDDRQADLS